jgi:hypothetical protein
LSDAAWIELALVLVALAGGAWWADRKLRRRGSRVGRAAVWSVAGLGFAVLVLLPLVGLLLLWYLSHAE